jgi:uncharacterized protein
MHRGRVLLGGEVFAEPVEVAVGFFERLRGLLGRAGMAPASAMIIERCASVHTLGMRFAIDLIFLDREWRVVALRRGVNPGRPMVCGGLRAVRVLESAAGSLALDQLALGDQLVFEREVTL